NLTPECEADRLADCHELFVPTGSQYVLQTIDQLERPQPNNVYAEYNRELAGTFGDAIEQALPHPGNPLSYPSATTVDACAGAAAGPGIKHANPFFAPAPPPAPNVLAAAQATAVNSSSGGAG